MTQTTVEFMEILRARWPDRDAIRSMEEAVPMAAAALLQGRYRHKLHVLRRSKVTWSMWVPGGRVIGVRDDQGPALKAWYVSFFYAWYALGLGRSCSLEEEFQARLFAHTTAGMLIATYLGENVTKALFFHRVLPWASEQPSARSTRAETLSKMAAVILLPQEGRHLFESPSTAMSMARALESSEGLETNYENSLRTAFVPAMRHLADLILGIKPSIAALEADRLER